MVKFTATHLGCKQHEVGVWLHHLIQLRHKQLTVVIQQPVGWNAAICDKFGETLLPNLEVAGLPHSTSSTAHVHLHSPQHPTST